MKKLIKSFLKKFFLKASGKIKDRTVIVFESDDWGSVRNSNKEAVEKIKNKFNLKLDNYQKYDCLETVDDINALISILKKHKNSEGISPKFTLNYVLHNPDLKKCKEMNFADIPLESVVETYKKSSQGKSKNVLDCVKDNSNVLKPQFHSFIHFNKDKMIKSINSEIEIDKFSIENECIGMNPCLYSNLDTFNVDDNHINESLNCLKNGLNEFEKIFGYKSKSMIFPCYVWNSKLEECCKDNGVQILQGKNIQNVPAKNYKLKKKINIMGKKTRKGLTILTRNVNFETSKYFMNNVPEEKCVEDCLNNICEVLDKNVPAVVCTHRVNYVSAISKENRDYCLNCLDKVLEKLIKKYPNIEFLFSDELGELYIDRN